MNARAVVLSDTVIFLAVPKKYTITEELHVIIKGKPFITSNMLDLQELHNLLGTILTSSTFGKDGYNGLGFDIHGYDKEGYDKEGYNFSGYNKEGYDKEGYGDKGFDIDGFDKDGYDIDGFDKDGYDKNGLDANGNES